MVEKEMKGNYIKKIYVNAEQKGKLFSTFGYEVVKS